MIMKRFMIVWTCLASSSCGQQVPFLLNRRQSTVPGKTEHQACCPLRALSVLLLAADSEALFSPSFPAMHSAPSNPRLSMPTIEVAHSHCSAGTPDCFRELLGVSSDRVPAPRMYALPVATGIVAWLLASSIKVIGTADAMLVERFGVFNRQLSAGLHFTIPIIERNAFKCTTREQVLDIPPQGCITKDNAPLTADAVVYWKIVDPELARYAVKDLVPAIQNLVLTQLRSEIGKLTLDETFSARQQMNTILLQDLDRATDDWGVKVTRVEVRDILPSRDILNSMEMQMSAERKKRANILESEGRRESQVNDARGAADAVKLQAEAEASRIETVAEGEARSLKILKESLGGDVEKAMQLGLLTKYWTTQAELAASENTKILFYPSKATVPVTVDALREMLNAE